MIKSESNVLQKAMWENKSSKIIENNQIKKTHELYKEQRKRNVDIRRKKLSELLISEEEKFRLEINEKQETPIQVRLKMESKLKTLKEEREKERVELVKSLEEKRFFQSADELRKNDSEAFAFSCYLEQENQMLDKLKKREMEKKEEEVYVMLNNFENNKKNLKEIQQQEEKKKKESQTYQYLDWQKSTQDLEKQRMYDLKMREIQMLKEQWEKDLNSEKEAFAEKKNTNIKVYRDIEEFNHKEESEKQRRINMEKMKDKDLINSILEKEKALDEIDKKEKEKKVNEFHQNKKYLEYVMNQKKEAEAWMDRLTQIEADKQWQRTQEQWMKEEDARIQLLKQVYKEREDAVKYKKNVTQSEKSQILKERSELDNEIKTYQVACERIKQEEASRRKKHQDDLKYQISDKEKQRQIELQDKLYEERAAKLWEIEYQKKIDEQRQLHLKKLEEIKKRGTI